MYTVKSDWRQRDAEAYFVARGKYLPGDDASGVKLNGDAVRAAAAAGLIADLTPEAVDDLRPGEVLQLAEAVNAILAAAFDLPGE